MTTDLQQELRIGADGDAKFGDKLMKQAADALEKLEADNAALRQDAERYRWLRRRNDEVAGGVAANIRVKYRCVESELDAAIDAAMREGKDAATRKNIVAQELCNAAKSMREGKE